MSLSCSAAHHQIVTTSTESSGGELTNGNFNPPDTSGSSAGALVVPEYDGLDFRIRQRLEASRQGMLQLEVLRSKHEKLMQEVRIRLPHRIDEERSHVVSGKLKESSVVIPQTEIKLNDLRSDSPVSCCVSHRSSVSMDSGCVSLSSDLSSQSSVPSHTNRKFSLEEQRKKAQLNMVVAEVEIDENQQLVATAIESTTALRCFAPKCSTNWSREKSTGCNYRDETTVVVDSHSFSQITPPQVHRKFLTIGRSESVQTGRPCLSTAGVDPPKMFQKEPSPKHFLVNRSPVLHAKPVAVTLSSKIPTSPYMRLRGPQKPPQTARIIPNGDGQQSIFHANRIFVDRSPRIVKCRKQCVNIGRCDSDSEESPQLLRAQPAVVISRQQSYAHSNESSPCQLRKMYATESVNSLSKISLLENHQQLNRCESSQSSETIISDRNRYQKKEKDWKESEDL